MKIDRQRPPLFSNAEAICKFEREDEKRAVQEEEEGDSDELVRVRPSRIVVKEV